MPRVWAFRSMPDRLVEALSRDHGVHPYSKWRGAHWRLASLAELVPAAHEAALKAAEDDLRWLAKPRRLRSFPKISGRVRRCGSIDGLALYSSSRIGLAGDERLQRLADSLVETQWPDGGWNCDRRPGASHSSFHETWAPILGLAEHGRVTGDERATAAAERGAEFLLRHRVVKSHRTGKLASPKLLTLRYPSYWHYDLLVGLTTLARSVGLDDPRTGDALDLLEEGRQEDGTWRANGRWWRPPGSSRAPEAVDWGEREDELLTDRAREVLAAANRL
jgi:hypothetical protein